ncbi:hypothetical protein BN1723_017429, partial [Verticillium longisporum]
MIERLRRWAAGRDSVPVAYFNAFIQKTYAATYDAITEEDRLRAQKLSMQIDYDARLEQDQKDYDTRPLDLEVPQSPFPANVDLSDYIFALTTTFKRLKHPKTIEEWAYWLTDGNGRTNGGKLLVRLTDASDVELRDVTQRLADVGIDAEVSACDSRIEKEMAVRY